MSVTHIPADLRRLVATRANGHCEYCLIHEGDTYLGCQVDHIISEKHGGLTREDNLAYACLFCNRNKGSDISSIAPGTGQLSRLFHPRTDRWADHFRLDEDGIKVLALSEIGDATIRLLRLNDHRRLLEREMLRALGRYPG